MQTAAVPLIHHVPACEQRRSYRVERRFSTARRPDELVRDLLRAHGSGEA